MGVGNFIKVIIVLLVASFLINGCNPNVEDKIKEHLVGNEIEYFSISGDPLAYVVLENDIASIKKTEDGWKAEVGNGLKWDMYYDENGIFIRQEQLFQT